MAEDAGHRLAVCGLLVHERSMIVSVLMLVRMESQSHWYQVRAIPHAMRDRFRQGRQESGINPKVAPSNKASNLPLALPNRHRNIKQIVSEEFDPLTGCFVLAGDVFGAPART
jgi:hypothetical protein